MRLPDVTWQTRHPPRCSHPNTTPAGSRRRHMRHPTAAQPTEAAVEWPPWLRPLPGNQHHTGLPSPGGQSMTSAGAGCPAAAQQTLRAWGPCVSTASTTLTCCVCCSTACKCDLRPLKNVASSTENSKSSLDAGSSSGVTTRRPSLPTSHPSSFATPVRSFRHARSSQPCGAGAPVRTVYGFM